MSKGCACPPFSSPPDCPQLSGCVGLKPSYGRVSRHGLVAYASSLDCVGPMAGSVADCAALLTAIAGPDAADATCGGAPGHAYTAALPAVEAMPSAPLKGRRLGVVQQTQGDGVAPGVAAAVAAAVARLAALGADVVPVSLPSFALGLPAYYVIACSEASSNLSRYDGLRFGPQARLTELPSLVCTHPPRAQIGKPPQVEAASAVASLRSTRGLLFGPEVKRRILMGTYALSSGYYDAYYKRAQQACLVPEPAPSCLTLVHPLPVSTSVRHRCALWCDKRCCRRCKVWMHSSRQLRPQWRTALARRLRTLLRCIWVIS